MFKIVYSDDFKLNLEHIKNYIAKDNILSALTVVNNIINTVNLLEDFPYLGKEIDGKYRQIIETKYKFKIVYKIDKDTIFILSVFREQNKF